LSTRFATSREPDSPDSESSQWAVGEGFREIFGSGQVTVSVPKEKEFKGDVPEVDADAFQALPDARRQKLVDDGIVKIVPHWTRDFHGRVDIKTF
jgi:hypothetical protein